jgi:hypothetical protein
MLEYGEAYLERSEEARVELSQSLSEAAYNAALAISSLSQDNVPAQPVEGAQQRCR